MNELKVTTWNIKKMDGLLDFEVSESTRNQKIKRLNAIAKTIIEISPDVLCIQEGPKDIEKMKLFCRDYLSSQWSVIRSDQDEYGILGRQFIWFLVKVKFASRAKLLSLDYYHEMAGESWQVNFWSDFEEKTHKHYRHPQVLRITIGDTKLDIIGIHLKSKFVRGDKQDWEAGGERRRKFVKDALKARVKLATEATNVRNFIDARFNQEPNPAIMVVGDMNDGPGKEYFENQYLFFDLVSNIQGDIFFAQRFLNHALFDQPGGLRWTVNFDDFIDPSRNPNILIDHILFTQPLVDGSLSMRINENAGNVEHEIFERINANYPKYATSSDHRPVSVKISCDINFDENKTRNVAKVSRNTNPLNFDFNKLKSGLDVKVFKTNFAEAIIPDHNDRAGVVLEVIELLESIAGFEVDTFDALNILGGNGVETVIVQSLVEHFEGLNLSDFDSVTKNTIVSDLIDLTLIGLGYEL